MKNVMGILLALLLIQAPLHADNGQREKIGEVLGQAVYRDQLAGAEGPQLGYKLHALFIGPVIQQYYQQHQAQLDPTRSEIDQFMAYYGEQHAQELAGRKQELEQRLRKIDAQLKDRNLTQAGRNALLADRFSLEIELEPPGEDFALFMLPHWKLQRHLFDHYGGGRLLWQQRGLEAFDAMHAWLREQEAAGHFLITAPQLKKAFYQYWTEMDHGAFLIADPQRIRGEFLNPEWRRTPAKRP